MKTIMKTILQLSLFVALAFGMSAVADASGFVSDPWLTGNQITAVANVDDSSEGENMITLSGDYFYAFTTYQNKTDENLTGVKGRFDFPTSGTSSWVTVTGKLTANTGGVETDDYITITGMPDEWELELIDASVKNINGDVHDFCTPSYTYDYNLPVSAAAVANSWASFPSYAATLDTYAVSGLNGYSGLCDQGQLHATFRVIDVSDDVIIDDDDDLTLDTDPATSVTSTTAHLNGEVLSGSVDDPYFVYAPGAFVSCGVPDGIDDGYFDEGDSIGYDVYGLTPDTYYSFRVCGVGDDGLVSGDLEHFTTWPDIDDGGDDTPDASTHYAIGITDNSATLRGDIEMNDFDDGYVFFVYGESNSAVTNAAFAGSYGAITPDGDNLDKVTVWTGFDGIADFNQTVFPLDSGTTHHYRICVQYIDGGFELECGSVSSFTTTGDADDGGDDDDDDDETTPDAHTDGADEVDEDSAELNGDVDMNDFDDGEVFYVWGQNEGDIEDVEYEDSYSDIDEDGDNLQKEMVDGDLDGSNNYPHDVHGLEENEEYYFRICVEYYDDGSQIECGSVRNFDTDTDDDEDSDDSSIRTRDVEVGSTRADMCGDLLDDGGDSGLKTWIEYKRSGVISWNNTAKINRGEGDYCVTVTGLEPGVSYQYRASSEDNDGDIKFFRTAADLPTEATARPLVSTDVPTNIRSNSALLNGFYVSNADSLNVWFNYGRTPALGKQTRTYDKFGATGSMSHNFTNLASNTTYYYQAVARNAKGTAVGNILSFRTGDSGSVVVVEELEPEIDLASLGLGLSLIRLDIDDDREQVIRGENIEYLVSWENISTLDLTDIDLKVTLPQEVEITNTSRGIFDADQNAIFYTIDDLDDGEDGELTVFGTVTGGTLGSALTAEAAVAFDNPVNDAQENAADYDIDELVVRSNFGTASVFGLSNISFLGWLVILLGLLIIFLVARWLYLEREELRAQAYAGGYGRPAPAPAYNYAPPVQAAPQAPAYQAPAPTYQAPAAAPAPAVDTTPEYEAYRPNR